MTTEFETIVELLLVILTVLCIVQLVLVVLLLRFVKRTMTSLGEAKAAAVPLATPPAPPVTAEEAPVREAEIPAPAPVPVVAPPAPAVDLLGGSPDIQGSVLRLCGKHGLSDFIIATMDGLLVVSLSPGSSEEAARFSDLYRRKKRPDTPGVTFLDLDHRGEAMVGIVRSDRPIPPARLGEIGEDARKILNWWL